VKKFKATAVSPANIAFIKYWGWKNEQDKKLILPASDSISMNLNNCLTTTTVEFSPLFKKDSVYISFFGEKPFDTLRHAQGRTRQKLLLRQDGVVGGSREKVMRQVNRLRAMANIDIPVKIVSQNSFPANAGIASSASAFSALTLVVSQALGLNWDQKKLSIETRLSGSGSACRSTIDGFACWQRGENSEDSYAYQLEDESWWDLVDIVAVVSTDAKKVSSREGHELATTSPHYASRLVELPQKIAQVKEAILNKNFTLLGETIEQEAMSMHKICATSDPPIYYLNSETHEIMQALQQWRKAGLFGYFTMDAGPNVHVICKRKDAQEINNKLMKLQNVLFTIINKPCKGTRLINEHLF